jgi:hypothetical protein
MPEIRVQLSDDDYIEAAQAAARPSMRVRIVVAVISLAIAGGAFAVWNSPFRREAILVMSVWFGVVFGARIGQVLYIPRQARRVFKQQRGFQLPCTVSWTADGVRVTAEDGVSTTPWRDFYKAIELKRQFVLFLSEALFMMIPKRAFPNQALLDDFQKAGHHVCAGPPRRARLSDIGAYILHREPVSLCPDE